MNPIALLSSLSFESDHVLSCLRNVRASKIAGKALYKGRFSDIDILLLNTGIGKVNAAHAVTCVIEGYKIEAIINIGVSGAYQGTGLKVGDIAIATKEILGDEGVIDSDGWHSLEKIGIPNLLRGSKKYFNEFPLQNSLFKKAAGLINSGSIISLNSNIGHGTFITVSAASGSTRRARELKKRFNAVCENMEGAAIAQICALYNLPFLEVRGVSNIAGVRDKRKWNLKLASENCQKTILEIIRQCYSYK